MTIGLTQTEISKKHQFYKDWLKGKDDIEIVTLAAGINSIDDARQCDAIVLSGGVDIHPEFYGGSLDYPNNPKNGWNKERDLFEKLLFKFALDQSIPILGVCRGLQLINIALEGTLIQDLGDETLNKIHKGSPDKLHDINISGETLLYDIIAHTNEKVNSAHHQAIGRLGERLLVNAKSDDGTIEGIEWSDKNDKPFLLGIQWHPERMFTSHLGDSPASKAIRNRFIEEVKKSKKKNEDH